MGIVTWCLALIVAPPRRFTFFIDLKNIALPHDSHAQKAPVNFEGVIHFYLDPKRDHIAHEWSGERGLGPLAEGVGFEPTVGKPTPVFKTGTFGRSVIPPGTSLVEGRLDLFSVTRARRLIEVHLAKSNGLGRHLYRFVVGDEFECLLE